MYCSDIISLIARKEIKSLTDNGQYEVQREVDRKATSSFYTAQSGIEVIRHFLPSFELSRDIVVMDPFMGSGVLLTSIRDIIYPKKVVGIEINQAPYELAKAFLYSIYGSGKVDVRMGDAFCLGWEYKDVDLVVTNPPFIRWEILPEETRKTVLELFFKNGYQPYINRKAQNFHILGFLLIDSMLKDDGYVVSVLPAATFYTVQGNGIKQLLAERYDLLSVIERKEKTGSFCSGCDCKEVIIIARKRRNPERITKFYQYNSALPNHINLVSSVQTTKLTGLLYDNWLSLFDYDRAKRLVNLLQEGLDNGDLRYFQRHEIARGIKGEGMEFFAFPNKFWKIVEEGENDVIITDNKEELVIPKKYLLSCLKKPEHYKQVDIVSPVDYLLCIDDEPEGDVEKYIRYGLEKKYLSHIPAINRYKANWYRHVAKQVACKSGCGHVFIPTKLNIKTCKIYAYYSSRSVFATENFYVTNINNRLIAEWFNSSVMKDYYSFFARKISEGWVTFNKVDYLKIPIPADNLDGERFWQYVKKWEQIR